MQEFVTIPTYLIKELPQDKLCALLDILSMADENGEFYSTTRKFMNRWNWGSAKTCSFIKYLEKRNIIRTQTEHKQNTLFIVNTDFFASSKNTKNKEKRHKKITEKDSQGQEESEDQTVKKEQMYYPNDELLNSAFKEFLVMRDKIKKPLATKQALTRMMNRIQKLSGGDNDLAIKILNQSTDHCWQDVYEFKKDKQSNSYGKNGDRDILSEWRNS